MTRKSKTQEKAGGWFAANFSPEAARRVGSERIAHLRWLVDFANQKKIELDKVLIETSTFIVFELPEGAVNFIERPGISEEEMIALIEEIREGVGSFVDGRPWDIELQFERSRHRLYRTPETEIHSTWIEAETIPFRTLFLVTARELLRDQGAVLARCELSNCGIVFIRTDPRQRYCTAAHSNLAQQRRFRLGQAATSKSTASMTVKRIPHANREK